MEFFQHIHQSLLDSSNPTIKRELLSSINWDNQLICIKGFRGVGKTTFLLDYIKDKYPGDNSTLYINLNNFYFTKRKISSFADEFAKRGGKVLLFDQIQKYPDWSADLRKCVDDNPGLKIVFTSSPVLRVAEGNPDLNGIASINHLEGLSFREYLNYTAEKNLPVISFEDILKNHVKIAKEIVSKVRPLAFFNEYLKNGYFPYFIDNPNFYANTLLKHINLALEIDVPYINQIELKYLSKLRKLLHIIASETPFTPNVSKLAASVKTSRATIMNYLKYLKNAKLIHLLYSNGEEDQMKKPDKVYLHNTNLLYAIAPNNTENLNLRHTFFYNQLAYKNNLKSSEKGDFCVNGKYHFIVGGRKIEPTSEVYAASDVIEIGEGNKIPLWLFGFLY
ncbi:MAG: ATP-binding protein [Prolixibacteraceae bacterium]|nr:ATP-binding protein [Prolixibacteraceae bacterium]MBT6006701.1 ATP-binding protein [Prolixibacteraceae bacterium]MBT6766122.1 ATP-binding protein [Prolixibacteraceae bacterium]MBT7000802.1 ATP-binding protein [Prolixibacteraceae bacterium]MBT7393561.1 ATP-binding protein [Prolixibacteraceae bacterium]